VKRRRREIEAGPRRNAMTAWDGRPICPKCDRPYLSLRIVIAYGGPRHGPEPCQSCKQSESWAKRKAARGY
jgi:hypothetical protein